ncbi:hypothetical protein [Chitinophaga sp. XS-30]|uniref:hypothetical protein n=1 Tax=Chitinophaga sp. XS-30 TaxID=2604421 RepID=UPI00143D76BE|nr:hypothetical protein [Chitinophaga sp. XS-30]
MTALKSRAQCEWDISTVIDSSRCAASGTITVSLTGADAGAVTNLLFSLEPLTSGGYGISPGTSPELENIPAGSYRVVVSGVCNGDAVSRTKDVVVPGNYVQFAAFVSPIRSTLYMCNTGRMGVTLQSGKAPYQINITAAPAAYTGPLSFTTSAAGYTVDSLVEGDYTFSISDACNAIASQQTVSMGSLPAPTASSFVLPVLSPMAGTCNTYVIGSLRINTSSVFGPYFGYASPFHWSVSFDGGPMSPYMPMDPEVRDTLVLPGGWTVKDAYNKYVTFHVLFACGQVYDFPVLLTAPYPQLNTTANCAIDFNGSIVPGSNNNYCLPAYATMRNTSTNQLWHDTITSYGTFNNFQNLPFGTYTYSITTGDGYYVERTWPVLAPPANPYSAQLFANGATGNDGTTGIRLIKSSGAFTPGTEIELVSPGIYDYSYTIPGGYSSISFSIGASQSPYPNVYFRPGEYLFRITDECGVYDLPLIVEERDVYRYNFTYTQQQSCEGLKVVPDGTAMYNDASRPAYFRILSGPQGQQGFDPAIVPNQGILTLPVPGTYKIAMSASPASVNEYSPEVANGNGANVKSITYVHHPLAVDVNRTIGWICPGGASNSGSIAAYAINGSTEATGNYTYKLAAEGNGATGPYLATNTTGKFSTATSSGAYTLMVNQNYDIRVEDECGAAVVQTVKVIDFATAQVASADKPMHCVGDIVRFKVINLPTTAITYSWTGPNGFTSALQNPVIAGMTAAHAGTYHVEISADICENSIHDEVTIGLAPYIETCYSAVTDTSVNPYTYGLLGNWRPFRSYAYYGARKESDPAAQTNIRKDGTFNDFMAFWELQQGKWKARQDTTRWVWNAESTLFNSKGFELENKDPLGRYNAAIYGYDNAFPVAVVQNARYQETAYDGFEDYGFAVNACDTSCPADRRVDFSPYANYIDSAEHHSGRYSLRVQPGDTVGIVCNVADTAMILTAPAFNTGANACSPVPVLKSVRANKGVLLPGFTPLSGRKVVFSAWVKEDRDCNCTSYSSNRIDIVVMSPSGNTTITVMPEGSIIEGWQRYEQVIELPAGTTALSMVMLATGAANVYFDDIRFHPYHANMKSFVYDPVTLRLMAELDEHNYATFFEYDDDGTLTRVKKETERGVKTLKETRSALIKE